MGSEPLPLEGVKVVELTLAIAGPSAGATLADYGCDVAKIEPPTGDTQRYIISGMGLANKDPYIDSPHFNQVNRGKRSIVLDLKSAVGMRAMHTMLAKSDVFLSNYRYESLERLGLGMDALRKRHPHLIICPMTGWGIAGPDKAKPVYDVAGFWARSGAASSHTAGGDDAYPPVLVPGFGDMITGQMAVQGICAALVQRARTGQGRALTTSLLRTGIFSNSWSSASFFARGKPSRWGPRSSGGNPLLMCYRAKCGSFFWLLGAEPARHWPGICRAMGRPELIDDEKYRTGGARGKNGRKLLAEMDAVFATQPLTHWAAVFAREDVWWQKVLDQKEVAADAQAIENGAFVQVPMSAGEKAAGRKETKQVAAPVDFIGSDATPRRPVPTLGEHTAEVARDYGLSPEDVTELAAVAAAAIAKKQPKGKL